MSEWRNAAAAAISLLQTAIFLPLSLSSVLYSLWHSATPQEVSTGCPRTPLIFRGSVCPEGEFGIS